MAVKRIQLRGISRTPSDRMNSDGGVAESLNMQIDEGESAPARKPEDVSESLHVPSNFRGDVVYLHSTGSYINTIGLEDDGTMRAFIEVEQPEGIVVRNDVTIVGTGIYPDKTHSNNWYIFVMDKPNTDYNVEIGEYILYEEKYYRVESNKFNNGYGLLVCVTDLRAKSEIVTRLEDGEKFGSIESIGNTLVISTDRRVIYSLYKDGAYWDLGSSIPTPSVQFIQDDVRMLSKYQFDDPAEIGSSDPGDIALKDNKTKVEHNLGEFLSTDSTDNPELWPAKASPYMNDYYTGARLSGADYKPLDDVSRLLVKGVWDAVSDIRDRNHAKGIFNEPVFVSCGLRLYDGSVYAPTAPVPLGMALGYNDSQLLSNFFNIQMTTFELDGSGDGVLLYKCLAESMLAYKIKVAFGDLISTYSRWMDIVTGIDIFVSEPCTMELDREKVRTLDPDAYQGQIDTDIMLVLKKGYQYNVVLDPDNAQYNREKVLMHKCGPFFLLKSIDFSEFKKYTSGSITLSESIKTEDLALKESMPNTFMTNHKIRFNGMMSYNGSLNVYDITRTLSEGYRGLWGASYDTSNEPKYDFKFIYHVVARDGQSMDVESPTISETDYKAYGLLTYPDPRCKYAYVKLTDRSTQETVWRKITMRESMNVSASYYYAGIGKTLSSAILASEEIHEAEVPKVHSEELVKGSVYKSSLNNPFFFPDEGHVSICPGRIIGLATATQAVSTGQFGQYPIYAFTDEGIWALGVSDDGSIMTSRPLRRDVALSKDTIVSIDNAVVYATAKGVMLLSGSGVTDLSSHMNGRHFSLKELASETSCLTALLSKAMMMSMKSDDTFMQFIKGAKCKYDYLESRLIFFRDTFPTDDVPYQYVYKIDTMTWHKMVDDSDDPIHLRYPLNSSSGFISVRDRQATAKVLNYSVEFKPEDETQSNGVIITRPFDLDEPDVLKTINHLRIRGSFERYEADGKTPRVAYILLGSQDGIRFHRVGSLRGKSWKLFRIIILSKLNPTERISWIDIDYESRFTNKLR